MIRGAYYIPAAGGGFGLISETFVLDAPAAAPKAVKKNKGLRFLLASSQRVLLRLKRWRNNPFLQ